MYILNKPVFDDLLEEEIPSSNQKILSLEEKNHLEELQSISKIMVSGNIDTINSIRQLCSECYQVQGSHIPECSEF